MSGDTPTPDPTPAPAATPVVDRLPDGYVAIQETEHNRLRAENRKLRKEGEDRAAAEKAAEQKRQQDAMVAAGELDKALAASDARAAEAVARADRLGVLDVLRDEISIRGYAGEKASALKQLVDVDRIPLVDGSPAAGAVKEAVDATVQAYPALFKLAQPDPDPGPGKSGTRRVQTPAAPVGDGKPKGDLLTMEEYLETPQHIRVSPEFQERVRKARPTWPAEVPVISFAQEST